MCSRNFTGRYCCVQRKKEMHDIIEDRRKDPLGAMMLDYLDGREDACVEVESSTLEMSCMSGETMFRSYAGMDTIERTALQLCEGSVLDAGAGAGCHSLHLQEMNMTVDALDISPGCVEVMARREVKNVFHRNLFSPKTGTYNTVLMMMNGLGICGTLDGCNLFLQLIGMILEKGGQVLADSTDLALLHDGKGCRIFSSGNYYGETQFVMKYRNFVSDPFNWLYIDFNTLGSLAQFNGLCCEQIVSGKNGRYLARISLLPA
jgi:SAM-dependent methyltransferase